MAEIVHILTFKLRSFFKLSTELTRENLIKNASSLIVFGGFAIGAYYFSRGATDYLMDTARLGLFLLHRFLSMLLFVFFLSINVGNIVVSYAAFYRSPETAFYFTRPLSHTNLFLIKFLDNFFYSSTVFFLIALAVLMGYGSHFHMSWMFYVQTMVFMLIPFMLIAGCVAVMVMITFMRFADTLGVKNIVAILVIIYLALLYVYFTMSNPMTLVASVWERYPQVDDYYAYLDPPFAKYLPNHWIAESLYWTMRGDSSYALSYTIILVLASGFVFGTMMVIGNRLFYKSWLASLNMRGYGESHGPIMKTFSLTKHSRFDIQTSVLVKKEFWQFIREPSQWIHLGIISVLIITFITSVAGINLKQPIPFLQTISYMVLLLFSTFLIASIALRFVFPSISIEGMNFWSVLSAPVNRTKIFWLKFVIGFVPIVIVSEVLVIISHQSLTNFPMLVSIAAVLMFAVSFALVGLNLGAGSFFANFAEKNPIKAASSQSATLTFLISLLYLVILVGVVFIPINGYIGYVLRGTPFDEQTIYLMLSLFVGASLAMGSISILVGKRALRKDY